MREDSQVRDMTLRRKKPAYPSREQLAERRAWAEQFDRCWVCGKPSNYWTLFDVHEIASRGQSSKWADVRNYFFVCRTCHDDVLSWLCEAAQLAYKAEHDKANYDRDFINRIRSEAENAIDEHSVRLWRKFVRAISK